MAFAPIMEADPTPSRTVVPDRQLGLVELSSRGAGKLAAAVPSPVAQDKAAGGKRILLVVDDEAPVRSLVRMMGEHLGYTVLEAINGAEALSHLQLKSGEIDIVLTDVNMPVMDGLDLVRAIKKLPARPEVAVMSGRFDAQLRAALQAEGIAVMMSKPFSTDELGLTLAKLRTTVG